MECTLVEIERKRQIAKAKLADRRNGHHTESPIKFNFKANSPLRQNAKPYSRPLGLPSKSPVQFYGTNKVVTGTCRLITEKRFVVELSGFSEKAVAVFKTIHSRNYNSNTRHWDFRIGDHGILMKQLASLNPEVKVEKLPSFVVNSISQADESYASIDLSRLEPELGAALMPFQQEGVRFGIDKDGRCLIADDMGLGKTFQALGIANYYRENWPLLVVTTSSMKNVWVETIHKYFISVALAHVQYMTSKNDYIGDCQILIVSHDLMTRCKEKLLEKNFGVIIIDESHIVKNFKAKCTQAATALCKKAQRVVLLSGTPALSRPSELFSQLSLVNPTFFGGFFEYSRRYCDGKQTNFGWDASGKSNLQELDIILRKKFMIRRTKEDVLKSLPNKTQEIITLDVKLDKLDETDRKGLNALSMRYNSEKKPGEKHSILLTFFNETARIKIPSVCSYLLQLLQIDDRKFIIFGHHYLMLDAICSILNEKGVIFIRIDGSTPSEQRKANVDKFQINDKCKVAVLSITAACAGITLTAAQLVVFAELHWNPSILSQAESRAHRIGQENPVIVRYLLASGTADDSIWPMLREKQKILGEAGLCKDSFDNVPIVSQSTPIKLTEGYNFALNQTSAGTLDISSYFKTDFEDLPQEGNIFDDGCDDLFSKIEF